MTQVKLQPLICFYIKATRISRTREDAVEKIWQALYQCSPDGETASYVKLATGYNPKQLAISIEPVAIGKEGANLCLRTTLTVGLRPEQDPQGNT